MTTHSQDLIFPNLPEITITRNKHQHTDPKKESKSTKKYQNFRLTSSGHGNNESPNKKFKLPLNKSIKSSSTVQKSLLNEMSKKNDHSSHLDSFGFSMNNQNSGTLFEINISKRTK